jgi:hypothetical protein
MSDLERLFGESPVATPSAKVLAEELNRIYSRDLLYARLVKPGPPPSYWRRKWNWFKWRFAEARERLGEIIAGRRFNDDY